MKKLLATTAIIAALSASPAYAWEPRFVLLGGQIWNGTSSNITKDFLDKPACENAYADYAAKGKAAIAAARPNQTGNGIVPIFWHTCSPFGSPS